jgi:4-carboxymuconolactone decarboxylase
MVPPAPAPRIPPLRDDAAEHPVTLGTDRNDGRPLNIFATLARHRELFSSFSKLGTVLLFKGVLPARERELVILRVGWRSGSEYEYGQHTVIGRDAGLTETEIDRLVTDDLDAWSDDDRTLIRLADELCATDDVSDHVWEALAARWDEQALLELLMLAGFYRLVSGFLNGARVALEPTTPGWPASVADAVRRAPREAG